MRDVQPARVARHHDLHLEQFDERCGARAQAVAFEQCLFFERLEVEVLRERVRRSSSDIAAGMRGGSGMIRSGYPSRPTGRRAIRASIDSRGLPRDRAPPSVARRGAPPTARQYGSLVILPLDPEPFDPAQHDVVAAVREPFDVRHHAAAADE